MAYAVWFSILLLIIWFHLQRNRKSTLFIIFFKKTFEVVLENSPNINYLTRITGITTCIF